MKIKKNKFRRREINSLQRISYLYLLILLSFFTSFFILNINATNISQQTTLYVDKMDENRTPLNYGEEKPATFIEIYNPSLLTNQLNDEEDEDEDQDNDDDDDGVDEEIEMENERDLQVESDDFEASIESELKQGENKNKFKIQIELNEEGVQISAEFNSESTDSNAELHFSTNFHAIYEYLDMDENGIYTQEIDELLGEYYISTFKPIEYEMQSQLDGSVLHYFKISTLDNIFTLHMYITGEFQKIQNITLTPAELKIDVEISQFPFNDEESRLALQVDLESENDYEEENDTEDEEKGYATDEKGVFTENNGFSGFFSWSEYALVDNVQKPVRSNPFSSDSEEDRITTYLLNYAQGESIFHDPKIGFKGILTYDAIITPPNPDTIVDFFKAHLATILLILLGLIISAVILTKTQFIAYLQNRAIEINSSHHKLTMEDVLENEYRNRIIEVVLEQPGIHYSELFREISTTPSNFAWHLDVLESYKVIKKARVGQYLVYYPFIYENPFREIDPAIVKSKTTLHILDFISEEPGITQHLLAKRLSLNRKTVKYHLDKLIEANLITTKKEGRLIRNYISDVYTDSLKND